LIGNVIGSNCIRGNRVEGNGPGVHVVCQNSGDRNRTAELQLELVRMRQFYTEGGSPFVAMKAACEMMNISGTATSFAYVAPSAEKRQRIRELLEREGLLS
ncbi:MAG: hypothetical protein HQ592_07415, partial [Planctomycetes bacterium]|nr:hypothetical protein [Planctomycetota bacterium]